MLDIKFTTIEEGFDKLSKAVIIRNQMGGALYYNICNDDCCELANKLHAAGADSSRIDNILQTGYCKTGDGYHED